MKSMCDMAQDLQQQKQQEQASLEPHLRDILKRKRLRLFETLLQGIDYPDKGLVRDMKKGFSLTLRRDEVWADGVRHNRKICMSISLISSTLGADGKIVVQPASSTISLLLNTCGLDVFL